MCATDRTIETYDARAIATGVVLEATVDETRLLEDFVRRIGRPLPQLLVVGRRLAAQVSALETIGADATGIDASEAAVRTATSAFPDLNFRHQNASDFEFPEFDGVWTENLMSRVPADLFESVVQGLLNATRPGGLLRFGLRLGESSSTQETKHGPVVLRELTIEQFENTLNGFDCSLLANVSLGENRVGLTFRKEY
ncbi:MAG: class I SAM-dependent methyltransferase [Planctomycetota bacterium]|jgi:hypothetical protein